MWIKPHPVTLEDFPLPDVSVLVLIRHFLLEEPSFSILFQPPDICFGEPVRTRLPRFMPSLKYYLRLSSHCCRGHRGFAWQQRCASNIRGPPMLTTRCWRSMY